MITADVWILTIEDLESGRNVSNTNPIRLAFEDVNSLCQHCRSMASRERVFAVKYCIAEGRELENLTENFFRGPRWADWTAEKERQLARGQS